MLLGGRPIRVGPSNGPIIQPTAYGPGAETMRNRPPLWKVSEVGDYDKDYYYDNNNIYCYFS